MGRLIYATVLASAMLCVTVARGTAGEVEFNRDVRPILADKCFTCHGPDAAAKKVPFRLDSEAAAKATLPSGKRAIVEGDAAGSELVQRVSSTNAAQRMPPVYSGLKLSQQEIDTLRTWVAEGARWEKHWAFIPPRRYTPPEVKDARWPRNPIDNFILARLEREGLDHASEADKETLLRRVTLDLTGLPPTPAEIDAFLQDQSTGAYERAVDRLLASPRYGERMAERWLDASRYADTNGYQYDPERQMWRWRDWVINAFNRNEPFNQFTLEQIAGDMLPNATLDQKIATGFNRNHRTNNEFGIVDEEYLVEYLVDRVDTTSTVFLGLTLGCARCHNHKYDPFTQKEFYQIYAYFNSMHELGRAMKEHNSPPLIAAPTDEQQAALKKLDQRILSEQRLLENHEREIEKAQRAWERERAVQDAVYWSPGSGLDSVFAGPHPTEAKPSGGAISYVPGKVGQAASFDGKAYLDAGKAADFDIEDPFSISAWIYSGDSPDGSIASKMVDKFKGKGFGLHIDHGRIYVHWTGIWESDAIRMKSEATLEPKRWYQLTLTYTGCRQAEGVHVYLDGQPLAMQVELDNLYRPFNNSGKAFTEPFRIGAGWGAARRFHGLIDDLRVYSRVLSGDEIQALALGETIDAIAAKPVERRSKPERLVLRWRFLESAAPADYKEAWKKLLALNREKERFEHTFPTVMVMAESPVHKETHLLIRGAYDKPGEVVQPGVPAVLPPLPPGAPNNRLGFAEWLIDPGNPLLARVTVNRFWQMYFGTGIVKTVEDFGVQGEWPSHPELLDWLATEFVRTGWDVKAMQKLIVTSAAYRQSSKTTPALTQRDPENRLLAHGPRFRLPAEMIHDEALFVAGLLKEKIGGPSVKPYQPAGLWKELAMMDVDYVQGKGDDLYRRALYTFWKRTVAPPMMITFDAAARETCVVRETRTNTPLQALDLMNDVQFVEAARFLGQRMMKEGGAGTASRLRYGFRVVLGRFPSESEAQILRDDYQYQLDYFSSKPDAAQAFLSEGESHCDPALSPRELAAYASIGSLLLNLDGAISKE